VTVVLFAAGLVPLTMIYTIETISAEALPFGSLIWLLRACPSFALGEGLIELCKYHSFHQEHGSPFARAVSGDALKALFGSIVPFFACLLFLENHKVWLSVRQAREWVASGNAPTSKRDRDTNWKRSPDTLVQVESATKVYVRSIARIVGDAVVFLWQNAMHFCRLFLFSLMARDLPEKQDIEKVNAPKLALDGITLSLKKGETLGIVGASGNGYVAGCEIDDAAAWEN
jgi:ABC-type multidrug transport system fused ATPase/permease subunit